MKDADGSRTWSDDDAEGPLPNRFTRGTLTGCLGILCVLALPALLFVPVEAFHLPEWVQRLIPLTGVAAAVLGAWLLSRVPPANGPRMGEPDRPLTRAGRPPVLERPATRANRYALASAVALVVCCVAGYALVSLADKPGGAVLAGTLVTYVAGAALIGMSLFAAVHRMPAPAWRWERVRVQRTIGTQAVPFACAGVVAVVWALFVAAGQGYFWAPLGVGAMILAGALTGPVLQRLPERGWRGESWPPAGAEAPTEHGDR